MRKINSITKKTFTKAYKALLKSKTIQSKMDMARVLDTYSHVVLGLCDGRRKPNLIQLHRMVAYYGIDANYIIGISEEMFDLKLVSKSKLINKKRLNTILKDRTSSLFITLLQARLIETKTDLARRVGTLHHVVHAWTQGKRNPTLNQLRLLCIEFNVNLNYILGLSDDVFRKDKPKALDEPKTHTVVQIDTKGLEENGVWENYCSREDLRYTHLVGLGIGLTACGLTYAKLYPYAKEVEVKKDGFDCPHCKKVVNYYKTINTTR